MQFDEHGQKGEPRWRRGYSESGIGEGDGCWYAEGVEDQCCLGVELDQ